MTVHDDGVVMVNDPELDTSVTLDCLARARK